MSEREERETRKQKSERRMAESRQTYYEILGVKNDANINKIDEGYHIQIHKIKQTTERDIDYEKKIHKAHITLTDPKQKRAYDLGIKHGEKEGSKDTYKNQKNRIEPYEKIKI